MDGDQVHREGGSTSLELVTCGFSVSCGEWGGSGKASTPQLVGLHKSLGSLRRGKLLHGYEWGVGLGKARLLLGCTLPSLWEAVYMKM